MDEIMRNTGQTQIEFKLVTGDKGENATKLDGILQAIVKAAQKKGVAATGKSVSIRAVSEAGVEMSATQVRKDALKALITGDGSFHAKYSGYYGPQTENVFGEIAQIATSMPPPQVISYIATGELPKSKKSKPKSPKSPKSKKKRKKTEAENVENV
jgi:urocanate hydratase